MTTTDARNKLDAARLLLVRDRPYLASAAWAVTLVASDRMPTLAVDARWTLYYHPDYVDRHTVKELRGVWEHELSHLLRGHHARFPETAALDIGTVLIATDCEINSTLVADRVSLPSGAVYPVTYALPDGLLAEDYYRLLSTASSGSPGSDGDSDGSPGGDGDGGTTGADTGVATGDCGSCAGGPPRDYEDWAGAGGLSELQAEAIRDAVAAAITDGLGIGRTTSRAWRDWASQRNAPPSLNWQRELQAHIHRGLISRSTGYGDYTMSPPSRRHRGVLVAAPVALRPRVAVVLDTSGSISSEMIYTALVQIETIARRVAPCTVLAVDSAVRTVSRGVHSADSVAVIGGGGTDMGVGIQAAVQLRPAPSIIVVLTDGLTPWPSVAPAVPVIVCLIDPPSRASHSAVPGWARAVVTVTT